MCVGTPPDKTGNQGRGGRGRKTLKKALIHHMRVDVEARQSQRSAGAVHKGGKPAPAAQMLQRPHIGDQCGRSAKRHHVRERIHLLAKCALRIGHTGDPSVQAIEHHGTKNSDRRMHELAIHRHHHAIKTTKQSSQGEEVGQDVNAFAGSLQRNHLVIARQSVHSIVHIQLLMGSWPGLETARATQVAPPPLPQSINCGFGLPVCSS